MYTLYPMVQSIQMGAKLGKMTVGASNLTYLVNAAQNSKLMPISSWQGLQVIE